MFELMGLFTSGMVFGMVCFDLHFRRVAISRMAQRELELQDIIGKLGNVNNVNTDAMVDIRDRIAQLELRQSGVGAGPSPFGRK